MRQLSIVLIASLFGFSAVAANTPAAPTNKPNSVAPSRLPRVFGPGPVINPENSQYMEDKSGAMKKAQQAPATLSLPNHQRKQHHGRIPAAKNQ
ncbi:hypothetical protein D3C79_129050 [compost metagenome]